MADNLKILKQGVVIEFLCEFWVTVAFLGTKLWTLSIVDFALGTKIGSFYCGENQTYRKEDYKEYLELK